MAVMKTSFFNKALIWQQLTLLVLLVLGTGVTADRMFGNSTVIIKVEQMAGTGTHVASEGLRCIDHWQIADARWYQLFFFSDAETESVLQLLFLLFIIYQGFLLTRKLNPNDLFSAPIAGNLTMIAGAIMILYLSDYFIYLWMKDYVAESSKEVYKISRDMRLNPWVIFAGLGFQWFANLFRKGYKLQQEQNLTI